MQIVGPDLFFGLGAVDPDVGGAGIAPVVKQYAKAASRDLLRQRHELVVRAPAAGDQHHPGATVAHDLVNDIHAANVFDRHRFLHCCGAILEHDPEKWKPVFRKDHAPLKCRRYSTRGMPSRSTSCSTAVVFWWPAPNRLCG